MADPNLLRQQRELIAKSVVQYVKDNNFTEEQTSNLLLLIDNSYLNGLKTGAEIGNSPITQKDLQERIKKLREEYRR